MELLSSSGISGVRTRIAVLSIWIASSNILLTCLSIISSAALAGSSDRMNRFIFGNSGNSGNTCNAYSIGFKGLNSFQFSIWVLGLGHGFRVNKIEMNKCV